MRWTREKPTEPGWYWLRFEVPAHIGGGYDIKCKEVVEIKGELRLWWGEYEEDDALPDNADWQGPIRPEEAADGATDA